MFKRGTIVKISRDMCKVFSIPIPYGIITNTSENFACGVRLMEVCNNDGMSELIHYILELNINELEET